MQYIIKTRNSQGRKAYVKADEAKHKVTGDIVYTGFTRNKHLAHHYANLKEAQELEETQVDFSWNDYFEVVPLVEGADDYISDDWEPV